jgi:multiple sugar transport system permease protein
MAVRGVEQVQARPVVTVRPATRFSLGPDALLGYLLISPAVLYILFLVGYPFVLALYFSVSNATVAAGETRFVGLTNYLNLVGDSVFRKALLNTFLFTLGSVVFKGILGIGLAFLLLRDMPGKQVIRGFLMLPWTLPISLSVLGWKWMFDPQFSVVNFVGSHLGLIQHPYPDWLGDPTYAFIAVLTTNVWRGFPFGAVVVLAGLTSIAPEIYDAAKVDGAGFFYRWHYIITPMIAPILFVGLIFDVVFTLGDLTIVYLLTNGGPMNATDILPTLAFRTGILGGDLGRGAATALFLFPILLISVVFFLRILRRRETM